MEETLQIVKKAVAEYDPDRKGKQLKAARTLLSAIVSCRRSIEQSGRTDRASADRMARELDELLATSPSFRSITADKKGDDQSHNQQAGEHLDLIQEHLKSIVKEQQDAEAVISRDWVKTHPVFSELKQWIDNPLPKSAYVLLFRQKPDNALELITQSAQDGRIFTRLRPHEFGNESKLHRIYRGKLKVVGAAVLAEKELLTVIGNVPQPEPNKDQMQTLLALSSKAASRPATDFMEKNFVLKELNELSHKRKLPKDAYILLFRVGPSEEGEPSQQNLDELETSGENGSAELEANGEHGSVELEANDEQGFAELEANDEQGSAELEANGEQGSDALESNVEQGSDALESNVEQGSDALKATAEPGFELDGNNEHTSAELKANDEQGFAELESNDVQRSAEPDGSNEPASAESQESSQLDANAAESTSDNKQDSVASENTDAGVPELVTRKSNDGRIITRFWPSDFVVKHKVFDTFRGKPPIVGAAVIKHSELCQTIGRLPQPEAGKTQLEAVLRMSRNAVERPVLDYLEEHEVLKSLHELSNTLPRKDGEVVLFNLSEQGHLEIMPMINSAGQSRSKIPLTEFQAPKAVHDRFAGRQKVVGASVIGEEQSFRARPTAPGGKGPPDRSPDRSNRRDSAPETRPVVFAAFGRTPLKINLMCTPETLKRLGINLL
jgi:hypothetical protein